MDVALALAGIVVIVVIVQIGKRGHLQIRKRNDGAIAVSDTVAWTAAAAAAAVAAQQAEDTATIDTRDNFDTWDDDWDD